MGSRDAKCYLASPEVVAASAVAGYIRGPHEFGAGAPQRNYTELAGASGGAEKVEILAGFPQRVRGRLVFMPQDNVNTDAIYGKDYTYRDDMTPEMMAKVVMENYDPQFAACTAAGDVIVSQFNFGTGSSREQAVTCLKAKGIPLVIAASFSQTYLRNAFNNGFLCIEVPEFVARLREQLAKQIAARRRSFRRRHRHRLHCQHDYLARGEIYVSGAGQRAAIPRDRGRSGEFGSKPVGCGGVERHRRDAENAEKKLAKFTVILEFRGGTYIRQVRASSPKSALKKVADRTDSRSKVFCALLDEKPVAIEGVTNCWCSTTSYQAQLALVNIVKTAE
jgi:hypothetical protein